jgi:predicted GNAT family acetyltransferase
MSVFSCRRVGVYASPGAQSAGFVFRNFESVWEIGGVFTHPEFRRHGLARQVVAAALSYLIEHGQIP